MHFAAHASRDAAVWFEPVSCLPLMRPVFGPTYELFSTAHTHVTVDVVVVVVAMVVVVVVVDVDVVVVAVAVVVIVVVLVLMVMVAVVVVGVVVLDVEPVVLAHTLLCAWNDRSYSVALLSMLAFACNDLSPQIRLSALK